MKIMVITRAASQKIIIIIRNSRKSGIRKESKPGQKLIERSDLEKSKRKTVNSVVQIRIFKLIFLIIRSRLSQLSGVADSAILIIIILRILNLGFIEGNKFDLFFTFLLQSPMANQEPILAISIKWIS